MPKRLESWKVSDEFWERVEPLIPKKKRDGRRTYKRSAWWWRPPLDPRRVFEAIVYVLRTGIQWKALPKEYGSASSVHTYFQEWEKKGVFMKLWKKWLAEYDEMEWIAWKWQSADGAMNKARLGGDDSGDNPTDRGKKMSQKKSPHRWAWYPTIDRRIRS